MTSNEHKIFESKFKWFLAITTFVGLFPILLYPFSYYFGKQDEFREGPHGPLHQYPDGDFYLNELPNCVDWLITKTFLLPLLAMLAFAFLIFIFYLVTKKYKIGFSYLIPVVLCLVFLVCQFIVLYWLFD